MSTTNADRFGRQLCFIERDELPANQNGQGSSDSNSRRKKSPTAAIDAERFMALLHAELGGLQTRIAELENMLRSILDRMATQTTKEYYTTLEIARILNKKPYTVREWCRLGRVNAQKAFSGRGLDDEWRISHDELLRIQNEGLLEIRSETQVRSATRLTHPR